MPMTDAQLEALFRKHVPLNEWHINPQAKFVGSRFYAFARELEHHALAAGLLIGASDPIRPAPSDRSSSRNGTGFLAGLWAAAWSWIIGHG